MIRELNDAEVVRLINAHCTPEERKAFQQAVDKNPSLVATMMNYCFENKSLTEAGAIRELKRAIRMLRQGGDA